MGRHEQREQVFKLLFRVEFHSPEDMPEQLALFRENNEEVPSWQDADRASAESSTSAYMLGAYRAAFARLQLVSVFLWRTSSCPLLRQDSFHRGKREDGTHRSPLHAGRLVAGDRRKERLFQRKGRSCTGASGCSTDARPWCNGAVEAEDFHAC